MARRTISMNKTQINNKIRAKFVEQNENGTPKYTLAQIAADYDVSTTYVHYTCAKSAARSTRHNVDEIRNTRSGKRIGTLNW